MAKSSNKKKRNIKIKGHCPLCKSKMQWSTWQHYGEPWTNVELPICTNENCNLSCGYGSNIKFRFLNHRTVEIEGLYDD